MEKDLAVPLYFEALAFGVVALAVTLLVAALVVLVRSHQIPARERVLWAVIVVLVPVVGAIACLALVPARKRRLTAGTT